jgi:hypothetical protein
MDRGYDSESIHRLIRDLHIKSVILIRSWNNESIGRTYSQELAHQFNDLVYPRGELVENKISVLIWRLSGDFLADSYEGNRGENACLLRRQILTIRHQLASGEPLGKIAAASHRSNGDPIIRRLPKV